MDWPLIIFVLAVIAISLGYWWYRQKTSKTPPSAGNQE